MTCLKLVVKCDTYLFADDTEIFQQRAAKEYTLQLQ